MSLSRRQFLRTSLLAGAATLVPTQLAYLLAGDARAGSLDSLLTQVSGGPGARAVGYGPLRPDPDGLLDLPAGFRYQVLSPGVLESDHARELRFASILSNGDATPPQHDGMAAFAGPKGMTILVRNHELNPWDRPLLDPARMRAYDAKAGGGTTTLWVDRDRRLVNSFASLSGTLRNCAGGATPWGSWISAEECVYLPGKLDPRNTDLTPDVAERHGYLFEVDASATSLVEPKPLREMGRFRHEAVAVDPRTGFAYLTEDRDDGLLYRFRPQVVTRGQTAPARLAVGDYARGGTLEALRIIGTPQAITSNHEGSAVFTRGRSHRVDWVPIAQPDPDCDTERDPADTNPDPQKRRMRTAAGSTRAQGFSAGAAQFSRCEGIIHHGGAIYWSATDGGRTKAGQVWRLEPARQRLTLVVEPNEMARLDMPDNLCVGVNGDVLACEDGSGDNFLVGITPRGTLYPLARNAHPLKRELAGCCFSPDGRTLFLNLQQPGITFAVWGPWARRRA
ncbi:MAG: alkaline phosphatase PhoX [Candidatus Eisenbacteria bacterium]